MQFDIMYVIVYQTEKIVRCRRQQRDRETERAIPRKFDWNKIQLKRRTTEKEAKRKRETD